MKVQTSRNKEYDAIYIDGPTRISGTLMMRLEVNRPILEVAAEFENLEWIRRESADQGNKEWTGYTRLVSVREARNGGIVLELAKPETEV